MLLLTTAQTMYASMAVLGAMKAHPLDTTEVSESLTDISEGRLMTTEFIQN